jgi:hypothetical protein
MGSPETISTPGRASQTWPVKADKLKEGVAPDRSESIVMVGTLRKP